MLKKYSKSGGTKALEMLAGYFRTVSLGFIAVALIEPLRNFESFNIFISIGCFFIALLLLYFGLAILKGVKD